MTLEQIQRLSDLINCGPNNIKIVDFKGNELIIDDIIWVSGNHSDGRIENELIIKLK